MKLKGRAAYSDPVVVRQMRDDRNLALEYQMRTPKDEGYMAFVRSLADHEKPFAEMLYRMACGHPHRTLVATRKTTDPTEPQVGFLLCPTCGMLSRHMGKRNELLHEWRSYCPNEFDAFDWEDLFTTDKTLWRYIFDEVQDEMLAATRTEGT